MSIFVVDTRSKPAEDLDFVSLKHPGNFEQQIGTFAFIRNSEDNKLILLEVHKAEREGSSLFVGNSVNKDGIIYLCTLIDPHFLLLSLLEIYANSRWIPLNQLFQIDGFPHYSKLLDLSQLNIETISDIIDSTQYIRLNDEKTMNFLMKKMKKLEEYFIQKIWNETHSSSSSKAFQQQEDDEILNNNNKIVVSPSIKDEAERLSLHILLDYLPNRWKNQIIMKYNNKWTEMEIKSLTPPTNREEEENNKKIKVTSWEESHGYAIGTNSSINTEYLRYGKKEPNMMMTSNTAAVPQQVNKKLKPQPMTTAQKKAVEVNKKGNQSISSFFSKKE